MSDPDESANDLARLTEELQHARERISELEAAEAEWKRAEEALQEANANLKALIENTSDYILFSDREGRPLVFNSAYAAIMKHLLNLDMRPGVKPHELLTDPEARAQWEEYHRRVLSGERFTVEISQPRPDGGLLLAEVSYNPVVRDGEVVGFSEFSRDITARKQVEEELRRAHDQLEQEVADRTRELLTSERRLRRAQRIARLGSWEMDLESDVTTWSEEVYQLFRVEPGRQIDRDAFFELVHPKDRSKVALAVERAVATSEPYDQEFRILWPDGEQRFIHALAEIERGDVGTPPRLVGMVQDVTARRRAEEERQRLERQVLQAQKFESLGVLTGGIAHDFNNLLMAIVGNADLALLELKQESDAWSHVQAIIETALKASKLTSQMLAYAGKGGVQVQPYDLNAVVSKMSHLLKSSISKRAKLTYQLSPGLPSIAVDAAQLRQVVLSLVTNADEAIEDGDGEITIRTIARRLAQPELDSLISFDRIQAGTFVVLEVADSGCGMDDETRSKAFDPFFSTKFAGRGLGLAAVQGIVRGNGGALELITELGKGSTFRVFFRAHSVGTPSRPPEPEPGRAWRGSGLILLVDDELPVRAAARQMLERLGFEVVTASGGAEAVELFDQRPSEIVCVVLDLQMPNMDGVEVFDLIRGIRDDVPVLLSSGYGEEESIQRFAGRKLAAFIQKPYRLAGLEEKLRDVLGRS